MDPWEETWVNHYAELGVPMFSDVKVCKKAYRKQAMKYHTDAGSEPNNARMVKLNAAFEVLIKNQANKTRYDQYSRENKMRTTSGTGASAGSPGPSGTRRTPPSSPKPPPASPKVYNPVIRVEHLGSRLKTTTEGEAIVEKFVVHHVSGELPPNPQLDIEIEGIFEEAFSIDQYPKNRFPTTVVVNITPQSTGSYVGAISFQILDPA